MYIFPSQFIFVYRELHKFQDESCMHIIFHHNEECTPSNVEKLNKFTTSFATLYVDVLMM